MGIGYHWIAPNPDTRHLIRGTRYNTIRNASGIIPGTPGKSTHLLGVFMPRHLSSILIYIQ